MPDHMDSLVMSFVKQFKILLELTVGTNSGDRLEEGIKRVLKDHEEIYKEKENAK